jgi:hypothetical protein
MRRRADLTRRPEDPWAAELARLPAQNRQPRPMDGLSPAAPWDTCTPKPDGFATHYGCRGEYLADLLDPPGHPARRVDWKVCACWCHYLRTLGRAAPKRVCGCGRIALLHEPDRPLGIEAFTAARLCRRHLGEQRRWEAITVELDSPSGGPRLHYEWIRGPVTPLTAMNYENNWRLHFDPEAARQCPYGHGRRPRRGCDWCQAHWFRHCLTLNVTGYGTWPLAEELRGNPVSAGPKGEPWDDPDAPQPAPAGPGGGIQEALFA